MTSTYRNNSYCKNCLKCKDIIRYNPYFHSLQHSLQDCDKPYLQNQSSRNSIDSLTPLSAILENCTNKSVQEFNSISSSLFEDEKAQNTLSCKFLNIDGNLKNFDTLLTTLKFINQDFSIIALAETNINPELKDTYAIPNYESVYQNKKENKRKGSGLGMYIHNSLNYQTKEELSSCNDDIESLFIEVKSISNSSPTFVGAIYRRPSGNPNSFIEKLSDLLSSLTPDSEAIILGDFNFNLFSQSNHTSTFEENMFCNGFTPVISTATHKKPNCRFTCIDNIFVNNYERVISSCTLENHITTI